MASDPIVGRVLGDTYEVVKRLGAGGMGAVYTVTHTRTGRDYAVKVLHPERNPSRESVERFRREARALSALGHAGIVAIHDFAEGEDGLPYMVMDLLEGEDLENRLRRLRHLEWEDALTILEQVASALGAAHREGIVHRDLKPANIFLARKEGLPEHAMVLDFGLAKMLEEDRSALTRTGEGMGTPLYMSPEQAAGAKLDARTDVYSLAAIFYELLTGSPPFVGPTPMAVLGMVMSQPPPAISQHTPQPVPSGLDAVLQRAMAKDATERFGSAQELCEAIRDAQGELLSSDSDVNLTAPAASIPTDSGSPVASGESAFALTRPSVPRQDSDGGEAAHGDDAFSATQPSAPPPDIETNRVSETTLGETQPSAPPPPLDRDVPAADSAGAGALPAGMTTTQIPPRSGFLVPFLLALAVMMGGTIIYLLVSRDEPATDPERPDNVASSEAVARPPAIPDGAPASTESSPEPTLALPDGAPSGEARAPEGGEGDELAALGAGDSRAVVSRRNARSNQNVGNRDRVHRNDSDEPPTGEAPLLADPPAEAEPSIAAPGTGPNPAVAAAEALRSGANSASRMADELDAFMPYVRRARAESQGHASGTAPRICSSGLAGTLEPLGRSANPDVASSARGIRDRIRNVCRGFGSPDSSQLREIRKLGPTLDRAERMARDTTVSTNQPQKIAQAVAAAIVALRRETQGTESGSRPFPCASSNWALLRGYSNGANAWAGSAARRVVNQRDRICRAQSAAAPQTTELRRYLDQVEGQLRSRSRSYRDQAAALGAQ